MAQLVLGLSGLVLQVALGLAGTADEPECSVDLDRLGTLRDIISNALMRGMGVEEPAVHAGLGSALESSSSRDELLAASASIFEVSEAVLAAEVEAFRHVNCDHDADDEPDGRAPLELTAFARNVSVHVVLHELGHALTREFDLPVLTNEEDSADAFATHYVTAHMPERAVDVLRARITSLMIEAREVPRAEWSVSGEHASDARRAHNIAALAVAADPQTYTVLAEELGMDSDDIGAARDYGTEIHRSWRRLLAPLWMPAGMTSRETRMRCDDEDGIARQVCDSGLADELMTALRRFDWHSQVSLHVREGNGGAGWSRSTRTISLHSDYVQRFIRQGKRSAR